MDAKNMPPLPFANYWTPGECNPLYTADQVHAYARAYAAERTRPLVEALSALLRRDERNTCRHDSTHRGGWLWTICDSCGARRADDEGGMPEWQDPPEWAAAIAALAAEQEHAK